MLLCSTPELGFVLCLAKTLTFCQFPRGGKGRNLKKNCNEIFVTSAGTVRKALCRCCFLLLHHPNTHVPGQPAHESQALSYVPAVTNLPRFDYLSFI